MAQTRVVTVIILKPGLEIWEGKKQFNIVKRIWFHFEYIFTF